jgi:hypothetical protein
MIHIKRILEWGKIKIKNLFNLYVRKKHNAYLDLMCISKCILPTLVRGLYLNKVPFASQFCLGISYFQTQMYM